MTTMKTLFMVVLLAALSGCAQLVAPPAAAPVVAPVRSAEQRLYDEAQRLSAQVARGQLTRTEVADRLGRLRVDLVGRNSVDDDVFKLYRQLAVKRDANQIEGAAAQQQMEKRLRLWLGRWPQLPAKPAQPAFTAFMLHLYSMPALGSQP